jgi:hypothetical protein
MFRTRSKTSAFGELLLREDGIVRHHLRIVPRYVIKAGGVKDVSIMAELVYASSYRVDYLSGLLFRCSIGDQNPHVVSSIQNAAMPEADFAGRQPNAWLPNRAGLKHPRSRKVSSNNRFISRPSATNGLKLGHCLLRVPLFRLRKRRKRLVVLEELR